jgi:protein-disulfide isomerase
MAPSTLPTTVNGERFLKVCSDCNSRVYTDYAREGFNKLMVQAINYNGNSINASINFSVDTQKPRISEITPSSKEYSKGFTNFTIKYTEDSLESISLLYGSSKINEFVMTNCTSGRNKKCFAEIDTSSYDGKQIQYYFIVRDKVHSVSSKTNMIFIDNTAPIITINSPLNGTGNTRYVRLNISVTENVKLEISENGRRFRTLCSNCNHYDRLGNLNYATHNLSIRATDKAGNVGYSFVILIDLSKAHIKGSTSAKVTIIEYCDFQCPYCGKFANETLTQIDKDYIKTGKVRFAFRQFPLQFHLFAEKVAEASECAGDQNKFWEYHDKLFANQQSLNVSSLKKYAADLGLDIAKFNNCLDSEVKKSIVQSEYQEGSEIGVTGTPSFFINGKYAAGAQSYATFKSIIDQELIR